MRVHIHFVFCLILTALCATPAVAQPAAFYTATYIEAMPTAVTGSLHLLRVYREAAAQDPGLMRIDVRQRAYWPSQIIMLTEWSDQKVYEAHTNTAHAKGFNEKIAAQLIAPTVTRRYNPLAIGENKPTAARFSRDESIMVVTQVDMIPTQIDIGVAALKQLAVDSRKHDRNLRFDVWQQIDRPNHFTLVELWYDRITLERHRMQPQTIEFRGKLAPITGALYDERIFGF